MAAIVRTLEYHPAAKMDGQNRKVLALKSLRQQETVVELAKQNQVSRQFIHEQKNKLLRIVDEEFSEKKEEQEKVLFNLPVTKSWIEQVVITLILECRSSFRGVIKAIKQLLDYGISLGKISSIIKSAIQKAKEINGKQDLMRVTLVALDELFHLNKPVLAGVDIPSLYCFLLSQEDHRDGDTWGIHLLDLVEQGFKPERMFVDDADGLGAGCAIALPETPIHLDNFHLLDKLVKLRRFFRNRLKTAVSYHFDMLKKMEKAKEKGEPRKHAKKLGLARKDEEKMRFISQSIDTLVNWMMHDVLNKPGPNPKVRRELYDFIVYELEQLAKLYPHRISQMVTTLKNQANLQLAFVDVLDSKFEVIANKYGYPLEKIWELCELQRCKHSGDGYGIRSLPLQDYFLDDFDSVEDEVLEALDSTERTSSMIENFNSRLSRYFFSRQEIGNGFLDLLRFYFNHSPFLRSERETRRGKTPVTILTKKEHPPWLEMLGYQPFKRAA